MSPNWAIKGIHRQLKWGSRCNSCRIVFKSRWLSGSLTSWFDNSISQEFCITSVISRNDAKVWVAVLRGQALKQRSAFHFTSWVIFQNRKAIKPNYFSSTLMGQFSSLSISRQGKNTKHTTMCIPVVIIAKWYGLKLVVHSANIKGHFFSCSLELYSIWIQYALGC